VQHATAFGHCAHHFAGEGLIDELVRPDKMVGGLFATSLRLVQVERPFIRFGIGTMH